MFKHNGVNYYALSDLKKRFNVGDSTIYRRFYSPRAHSYWGVVYVFNPRRGVKTYAVPEEFVETVWEKHKPREGDSERAKKLIEQMKSSKS